MTTYFANVPPTFRPMVQAFLKGSDTAKIINLFRERKVPPSDYSSAFQQLIDGYSNREELDMGKLAQVRAEVEKIGRKEDPTVRNKAIKILAKSLFRELKGQGYDCKEIVVLATELISQVTTDLASGRSDESSGQH